MSMPCTLNVFTEISFMYDPVVHVPVRPNVRGVTVAARVPAKLVNPAALRNTSSRRGVKTLDSGRHLSTVVPRGPSDEMTRRTGFGVRKMNLKNLPLSQYDLGEVPDGRYQIGRAHV